MSVPYILSDTSITVIINFTPKVIDLKHPNFAEIKRLVGIPTTTEADLTSLLDIPKAIATFTDGKVTVVNGKLFLNGGEVRTSLGQIIMKFIRAGQSEYAEPLKLFLANVAQNPDPRAQIDLYDWVQASGLPITSDGYVLAWKAVCEDYTSLHTPGDKRFDHHVGNRVEMPRTECDADPTRTCSTGLHFAGAAYLKSYLGGGARIVVVKIHPKDIVSFPTDYQLQKGRACSYDIVGEVPGNKVLEYYPQGVPVYRGFDKVAPAKPKEKFLSEAPVVGGVYRRRDGKAVVIVNLKSTLNVVEDQDGYAYDSRSGSEYRDNRRAFKTDLIEKIEFPLNADDFRVGDRWVTRAGKTVTITGVDTIVQVTGGNHVWAENGRTWGCSVNRTSEHDLVFNLDYGKKRTPRLGQFAVGQEWLLRNGHKVKITSTTNGLAWPVSASNGATYNENGRYMGSTPSALDLVTLVKDVD